MLIYNPDWDCCKSHNPVTQLSSGDMEKGEVIEGKVDWKGRPAMKGVHGGIISSLHILSLFAFDNFANMALAVNLVTYLNGVMHYEVATASNMLTNFMGTSYILAVVVAYLADVSVGRYKAVILSSCIEFLGIALITIQAHFPSLKPPVCNVFDPSSRCEEIRGGNVMLLYISLYLTAIGMAGIKASTPPHGADQFDETDPKEELQMSSFFNWLLLSVCVGGAFSLTLVVWIQAEVRWDWGFGVSTMGIFLGTLIFVAGVPRYRIHIIQQTNPITEIIQVYVASIRNRNLKLPEHPYELYEFKKDEESSIDAEFLPHRNIFRFLDKAAIQTNSEEPYHSKNVPQNPWKLCTVTQVESAKTILGMVPIFCSAIIMSTCLAQLQTFSVQQGLTMDARITDSFKIPAASLPIIPIVFLIVIVPVYDRIVVPFIRKFTGLTTGITHFQRIGVGLVLSCLSMAVAAIVEVKRKNVAASHGMLDALPVLQPLPISVFWLSFQYFIFGIADMFTYVGLLEFFYSEAPKKLKSIASSFLWIAVSLGYFLSSILVELVNYVTKDSTKSKGWLSGNKINRNHLNLFYWLLSVLSFLNFLNYLYWARKYEYKQQVTLGSKREGEMKQMNE